MDNILKTADRAAQWWADKLDTGDAQTFKADLRERIDKALRLHPNRTLYLENDYDPQGVLLDAVRATISPECRGFLHSGDGIFPRKHETAIKVGSIRPKEGYGNWTDEITI